MGVERLSVAVEVACTARNRFIVNDEYKRSLIVNGDLTVTSNLIVYGNNTILYTQVYTAENLEIYFASDAYPMAAKLLLEGGHYVSLRGLLNTTLYRDNFNYTRLYEFVFSNFVVDLKRNNFDAMNILNFLKL
jgi:hypothetical protein